MAEFFLMPAASPTMENGKVLAWRKNEGDTLNPQDVLAEVETDKAAMEIEVFDPGVLLKILVPAGADARVDTPIAIIGTQANEDVSSLMDQFKSIEATTVPTPDVKATPPSPPTKPKKAKKQPRKKQSSLPGVQNFSWEGNTLDASIMEMPTSFSAQTSRVRAAPAARRLANEMGVDISRIHGSGPNGRVMTDDLRGTSGRGSGRSAPTRSDEIVPNSNMRKTIAKRLTASYLDAPAFFLTATFDCDRLVDFRAQLKHGGVKVSYNDVVIKCAAAALNDVPEVNASWGEQAITRHGGIHIGMAVAVPDGLITPVVTNANTKDLKQIAAETRDLAARARDLKLQPAEYQGSTFTISNLGMMQIDEFTAIINPPNACILAVGSLNQQPVVTDGQLGVGWRMKVTLTCDHRVVDGALGATFLMAMRKYIEHPALLLVD